MYFLNIHYINLIKKTLIIRLGF